MASEPIELYKLSYYVDEGPSYSLVFDSLTACIDSFFKAYHDGMDGLRIDIIKVPEDDFQATLLVLPLIILQ